MFSHVVLFKGYPTKLSVEQTCHQQTRHHNSKKRVILKKRLVKVVLIDVWNNILPVPKIASFLFIFGQGAGKARKFKMGVSP